MTTNLPDTVKATTTYTVASANFADIVVEPYGDGGVNITQLDDDGIAVAADSIPGLIAALQAAAGITDPQGPAYVIDRDGDRWERASDGGYHLRARSSGHLYDDPEDARTLAYIDETYGIRESA